jgi:hypothetical protein
LNIHRKTFSTNQLQLSAFLYRKSNISESRRNSKSQEKERQPGVRAELAVQPDPDCQAEENGQGHRKSDAAVIGQFPDGSVGLSFHGKEHLFGPIRRLIWQALIEE